MQNLKKLKKKQQKIEKTYLKFLEKRTEILEETHSASLLYLKMRKAYPNFCPLYKKNLTCHRLQKEKFDCWYCYCPYYDYQYIDKIKGLLGRCKKFRNKGKYTNKIWDCSNCFDMHKY